MHPIQRLICQIILLYCTHRALNLEVTDTALFGVRTEDVIVLVDETIELVLEVLDAGTLVSNLELQVSREDGHDFC